MDRKRMNELFDRIIKFLEKKGEASTKEIWEYLKKEDRSIPEYSHFTRIIRILSGDPSILYSTVNITPDISNDSFMRLTVLDSKKRGKELIWFIKQIKFYSIPKRVEDEIGFWDGIEALERQFSPSLVRFSLGSDIEGKLTSLIVDICKEEGFIDRLLKLKPSEILEMCAEEGFISSLPSFFQVAVREILKIYTGLGKEEEYNDLRSFLQKIAEEMHLKEKDEDTLFISLDVLSLSEDFLICATDASKITSDSLLSRLFKIYLAFGIARSLKNDKNSLGYTYTAEPPLDGEYMEPSFSKIWHETDAEIDEYERRMERALLNRIHYVLESRIFTQTGLWYPSDCEVIPDLILHDGRLVPELFRPWDFISLDSEEEATSKKEYTKTNRKVVTLFDQLFRKNGDKILGVVKTERLPFLSLILILYLLLHIHKSGTHKTEINRVIKELCEYIVKNKSKPMFYLWIISIFGTIVSNHIKKSIRTCCIPRPLYAYTSIKPDKLEFEIDQSNCPLEIKRFFKKVYIPLLKEGWIFSWYLFPYFQSNVDVISSIIEEKLCYPKLEMFFVSNDTEEINPREHITKISGILCSEYIDWDLDLRHGNEFKLLLPSDLISVDMASLEGNKNLEKQIISKFYEIRKLAKEIGLIF